MLRWSIKLTGILMVWKCPPLNLFNWSNLWKWKEAMRDGGKGDAPRPIGVPLEKFDNNWDAIFKKKEKDEGSTRHRDEQPAQQDLVSGDKEH
jgi:hypothetical protein